MPTLEGKPLNSCSPAHSGSVATSPCGGRPLSFWFWKGRWWMKGRKSEVSPPQPRNPGSRGWLGSNGVSRTHLSSQASRLGTPAGDPGPMLGVGETGSGGGRPMVVGAQPPPSHQPAPCCPCCMQTTMRPVPTPRRVLSRRFHHRSPVRSQCTCSM